MSKLIVLSELNILDYLNRHDIYPSEFYTDFNMFRNRSSSFDDAIVVCILAGTCAFSKRHVVELCSILDKRGKNDLDNGIKAMYVLSDTFLPTCKEYYIYQEYPLVFKRYSCWKCKEKGIDFWGSLDYDKSKEPKVYLTKYDKGSTADVSNRVKQRSSELDELIRLIKIPKLG